jgi:twinkle protein
MSPIIPLDQFEFVELTKRKLTEETVRKFSYGWVKDEKGGRVQAASYYDSKGELVAQKLRYPDKSFRVIGDLSKAGLFGQQLWNSGKGVNRVVITEGEIDAMSVSQLHENRYPVVSIARGAKGAKKDIQAQLEWLSQFDEVVVMFDNDEAGQEAAKSVIELFQPGKVKIASLPLKDANEMLVAGRGAEVISAEWNAKSYRPDGIILGEEMWDRMITARENKALPYPFEGLQHLTLGAREGELIMLTAGTGIGKSTFARQIGHYWMTEHQERVGFIFLEEQVEDTGWALTGLSMKDRLLLKPMKDRINDETKAAHAALAPYYGTYDHFGASDPENIISKIRYLVKGLGFTTIILDHITIVATDLAAEKNERLAIDSLMTKLAMLVKEVRCRLIVISHLKKPDGTPFEEGAQITLDHLRGSASLKQLSFDIIALERDQQADKNDNVAQMRVLKCRLTGLTGVAGSIAYDRKTGIMSEVNPIFDE